MHFVIQWQVPKSGNSTLWPCYFGKCLLTVGGDEQQENAISPSILNVFVVHFLQHIPYMYVHISTIQNAKLVSVRMQHVLLTVVNSDEQQMTISLNAGCFCGTFFGISLLWIQEGTCNVRMQMLCTNHARNEIGVLTVCHSEQPYLVQNKFFLWHFF